MPELATHFDTTHLRFAVVDGPNGVRSVVTPAARDAALALKDHHSGRFWCSTVAGGCGSMLTMAAGAVRRPYFRHRPDAACQLAAHPGAAAAAYEHVRLQYALVRWLAQQGLDATVEHTFRDGGGRADLHVVVADIAHSLEVQLSPISVASWQERDTRYRRFVHRVSWLYGTSSGGEAAAAVHLARAGVALHVQVKDTDGDVQVGVLGPVNLEGPPEVQWSHLQECQLRPGGVWTPHLENAMAWHQRRLERAQAAAAQAAKLARHRDALIRRRQPRAQVLPLVVEAPLRPRESVAQWQRKRPVPHGWAPAQGWAWVEDVAEVDREAARLIAHAVLNLYWAGPTTMLDLDGVADFEALLEVMTHHGVLLLSDQGGIRRWERGPVRPLDGSGHT